MYKEETRAIIEKAMANTSFYATAILTASQQGTTRFANSEISQNVTITDANLKLTLYNGKRQASCSTNVLTDEGLKQLVQHAEALLAHVPEGEFEAFPFSTEAIQETVPNKDLANAFTTQKRAELIKAGLAEVAESEGYTAAGALVLTEQTIAVGNRDGIIHHANITDVTFNTVVTHQDGTAGAGQCISYSDVPDILAEFKKAQATAKAAHNPVEPELGAHTVILSPAAFSDLISFAAMMLNAKAVDDGRSFAAGKLGQKVFGDNLTITDDFTNAALYPLPFDMEGNPRRKINLVENGVLSSYVYDNVRAKKHGVQPTGHAITATFFSGAMPVNIVVDAGTQSLDEMIASTPKGIFINEFHYTNFTNARKLQVTGLTRNGAFLIENGKLTKPMATVRLTESLLDAFNQITAISKERTLISEFAASLVPAVRIENFHFTSKP